MGLLIYTGRVLVKRFALDVSGWCNQEVGPLSHSQLTPQFIEVFGASGPLRTISRVRQRVWEAAESKECGRAVQLKLGVNGRNLQGAVKPSTPVLRLTQKAG